MFIPSITMLRLRIVWLVVLLFLAFGKQSQLHANPNSPMMIAFVRALKLSGDNDIIWTVLRHMFIDDRLGDPGQSMDEKTTLNLNTNISYPDLLITVLEMYRATGNSQFLQLAEAIGENKIDRHDIEGYFLPTKNHVYTRFESPEPLAFLHLVAAKQGKSHLLYSYLTGIWKTDGEKFIEGLEGRPSDTQIYDRTIK